MQSDRHLKPVKDSFDPFEGEPETSYDPNEFYIRSVDKRGHKDVVHVPLPPNVYAELMAIVSNRDFPDYRTAQDLVRDAIVHRLHYLAFEFQPSKRLQEFIIQEEQRTAIDLMQLHRDSIIGLFDSTSSLMAHCWDDKNIPMLHHAIVECRKTARSFGEPYNEKFNTLATEYEQRFLK